MNKCPFFGRCGGCKYDFSAPDYQNQKISELKKIPITDEPRWIDAGGRRRADFCFAGGQFGFFELKTKNIIPVQKCPNLADKINNILPQLATIPWCGAGSVLVTMCDNGIDVAITSNVSYFTPEFRDAIKQLPIIRATWNDKEIIKKETPVVSFENKQIEYPSNAFLQPTIPGADTIRKMVTDAANGYKRIADLFCGLGNFTYALNADGFDIVGTGMKRDLFKKPLTIGMLNGYECVVMDPPRAGAMEQSKILAKSNVKRIIYVSCNPQTFLRDMKILTNGNYTLEQLTPVDQFVGSHHWELVAIFNHK